MNIVSNECPYIAFSLEKTLDPSSAFSAHVYTQERGPKTGPRWNHPLRPNKSPRVPCGTLHTHAAPDAGFTKTLLSFLV